VSASRVLQGWHPLVERLSFRHETLDENLIDLGISPHPRVVLALEGESELCHAPLLGIAGSLPPQRAAGGGARAARGPLPQAGPVLRAAVPA